MSRFSLRAALGPVSVSDDLPVVVVGALNVSPESFFRGSIHAGDDLVRAAEAMAAAGAAILDVGGMSTAPYLAGAVSEDEEADRLSTAIARVAGAVAIPLSADTARAGPARAALYAGATIINDVTGLRGDAAMASLVHARAAGAILMASPTGLGAGVPPATPLGVIALAFERSLEIARAAGISADRIVLDPGIGFFRDQPVPWYEWDATVLSGLRRLRRFGRPLCVAVSRKSFIGHLTGRSDPSERLPGSLAATALAVYNGAALIRTHDVAETLDAVRVAEALRRVVDEALACPSANSAGATLLGSAERQRGPAERDRAGGGVGGGRVGPL